MEILAPSGNWAQVIAAIEGGCNAIYGGLKLWNARSRANNFTISEYNDVLSYCKKHSVKFYLTLNIAFKNDEISDVLALFQKDTFQLPDAVIVSDIGLMICLRRKYPDLPVHVSTQFGAHCIDDIRYLESLGVNRIILSRELTMDEIISIREATNVELEVFIWGSQCIGFSGKCYWGAMILGGSGNRGKCIGLCRDIYLYNDNLGNYLYSQDLDATSMIKKLEEIGINSIKIEGRMRKPDELKNVLLKINNNSLEIDSSLYNGYLSNQLPVKNLIQNVSKRIDLIDMNREEINSFDKLVAQNQQGELRYVKSLDETTSKDTIKCLNTRIENEISPYKPSISIKIILNNENEIQEIDMVNQHGERKRLSVPYSGFSQKTIGINALHRMICEHLDSFNIIELLFNKRIDNTILFNPDEILRLLKTLNDDCMNNKIKIFSKERIRLNNILNVEIDHSKVYKNIPKTGIKNIIYNIDVINDLIKMLKTNDDRLVYKLPLFDWSSVGIKEYLRLLHGKRIMITRWSHLRYLPDYCFNEVHADYTLNIYNNNSLEQLKRFGIQSFTGSPELSVSENVELAIKNKMHIEVLLEGKIPLMYTRHCYMDIFNCDGKCDEKKEIVSYGKTLKYNLICKSKHRELYYSKPFIFDVRKDYKSDLCNISYRLVADKYDESKLEKIIHKILLTNDYLNTEDKQETQESSYHIISQGGVK